MAAVMWEAVKIDDNYLDQDKQIIAQLMKENASMRELLQISSTYTQKSAATLDEDTQTEGEFLQQIDNSETFSEPDSPDLYRSLSSSIIERSFDDSGSGSKGITKKQYSASETGKQGN